MIDLSTFIQQNLLDISVSAEGRQILLAISGILFGLLFLKPFFVTAMANVPFRNPLAGQSGGTLLLAGAAILTISMMIPAQIGLFVADSPDTLLAMQHTSAQIQDICDESGKDCDTALLDAQVLTATAWVPDLPTDTDQVTANSISRP